MLIRHIVVPRVVEFCLRVSCNSSDNIARGTKLHHTWYTTPSMRCKNESFCAGDYKQVPFDDTDVEIVPLHTSPPPLTAPIPVIAISPYNSYQRGAPADATDAPTPAEIARRIPWAAFFRHPVALTLLLAYWTNNWIAIMMLSEIPSYLTNVLHFNLKDAGVLSMLPYCAQFVATVCFGQLF